MFKVKIYRKATSLNEIYQQIGMRFALGKFDDPETIRQITPFVLCRDFLGDAIIASKLNINYSVYGFSFNGTEEKVDTDNTVLLIKWNCNEDLTGILRVIHYYESLRKWKKTILYDLEMEGTFLAVGSGRWMSSTQMLSMYTLLFRLGGEKIKQEETIDTFISRVRTKETNDSKYINDIYDYAKLLKIENPFDFIVKNWRILRDNLSPKENNIYDTHNNNGIVRLFHQMCNPTFADTINAKQGKKLVEVAKKEKTNV